MSAASKKVIYAALVGNALIAVIKFIASTVTGSSAMLSEGIHSLVDTGNQVLLLVGIKRSKRPPGPDFPYGHGKEVYFWSFVVAILIFAVGAGISIYEGIKHLLHPAQLENPTINYIVLGLAMLFEGIAWSVALKEFRKVKGSLGYFEAVKRGKDPTMFVVLFEDSAAMLGLVAAFAGILLSQLTGIVQFDAIASIIIGLILGGTAVWLAVETQSLLIGESASHDVVEGVRRLASECACVEHVNEVLTMHMGPEYILVNISMDFRDEMLVGQLEREIAAMDRAIKTTYPEVRRIFIEAEAAGRKQ
ncbi:MAG: cation diffusion facilitator family transporter [Gammaproteobacteria bacterium]|nr:cation diffusion facilitator family transporter [Gammaproteobacteria bacterium]